MCICRGPQALPQIRAWLQGVKALVELPTLQVPSSVGMADVRIGQPDDTLPGKPMPLAVVELARLPMRTRQGKPHRVSVRQQLRSVGAG